MIAAPCDLFRQDRPLERQHGERVRDHACNEEGQKHVGIDRKSTRLNSSHDQISYAVFCLKKKKNHYHEASIPRPACGESYGYYPVSPPKLLHALHSMPISVFDSLVTFTSFVSHARALISCSIV